jgi:hypothetical protein
MAEPIITIKVIDFGVEIAGHYEGPEPIPPEGYRFLTKDEQPEPGDLAFNIIGQTWHPINRNLLAMARIFSEDAKTCFRFAPVRKIEI